MSRRCVPWNARLGQGGLPAKPRAPQQLWQWGPGRSPAPERAVARLRPPLRSGADPPPQQAAPLLGATTGVAYRARRPLDGAAGRPAPPNCAWPGRASPTSGCRENADSVGTAYARSRPPCFVRPPLRPGHAGQPTTALWPLAGAAQRLPLGARQVRSSLEHASWSTTSLACSSIRRLPASRELAHRLSHKLRQSPLGVSEGESAASRGTLVRPRGRTVVERRSCCFEREGWRSLMLL